jgi:histone-lysine N-methyltransferase SETMAR
MDSAKLRQREIIFFLWKEGASGMEIYQRLHTVFGENALGKSAVYKWVDRFREGRIETEDDPRSGRPRTSVTTENIARVQALIEEDRRVGVAYIAEVLGISMGSVHHILVEEINLSKLCARWVPRLLTPLQKEARVIIAKKNISLIDKDPHFLERIVTVDETWVHHYDPESKEQSKQWLPHGSNPPVKAKVVPSLGKVMATVFWDASGILLVDYLEARATINAEYYANLLQNDLHNALRRKRPGKLSKIPLLLHDNARPHTAKRTMETIETLGWQLLLHPAYSPDLAPCDFYLFPRMKEYLRGNHFQSIQELKSAVQKWIQSLDVAFYTRGMEKLVDRYEKCIEVNGDYIEKSSLTPAD